MVLSRSQDGLMRLSHCFTGPSQERLNTVFVLTEKKQEIAFRCTVVARTDRFSKIIARFKGELITFPKVYNNMKSVDFTVVHG